MSAFHPKLTQEKAVLQQGICDPSWRMNMSYPFRSPKTRNTIRIMAGPPSASCCFSTTSCLRGASPRLLLLPPSGLHFAEGISAIACAMRAIQSGKASRLKVTEKRDALCDNSDVKSAVGPENRAWCYANLSA